ncbi:MAG: sodium:solute symporter [Gemmatimonadota bacterium]|nr:sodium:solute symporter [Gemmatimonadota bacterium]
MNAFTGLDLTVLLLYLAGVTIWGAWLGRGQSGGTDYFLGNRDLPWAAVLLSVVATETSTLTFLSVPGVSYAGTLAFLQLALGYLVGRAAAAALLLPQYFRGELTTAYGLLQERFGLATRRFASAVFMATRLLADSVRLALTAIPLSLITGWSLPLSIGVVGALTLVYTYVGGIKAVVWVDALQMGLYLLGALAAVAMLQALVPGGWAGVLTSAGQAGKLLVLDFSPDPAITYTFWAGLLGGAFLSMATHGTDQLIVQRLLACRDLRSGQKALVGSGVAVILQFALFLMLGVGLWTFYGGREFESTDTVFPLFIIEQLPPGVTGLVIAAVYAAAMSSLSSSINSLASTTAYDFWAPRAGAERDEARILRAGRSFSLLWATLLVGAAVLFSRLSREAAAVEVALGIASVVYGGLLGAFALGTLSGRADSRSVTVGMALGIGAVTVIWRVLPGVAFPWYVLIGSLVTYGSGHLLGGRGGTRATEGQAA